MTKSERKALRRQEKLAMRQAQANPSFDLGRFKWWGVMVLVVALIGYWIYQGIVPTPPGEADKPINQVTATDWVQGNKQASVVVIEYSDLQCPACRAYYPMIKTLVSEYGDRVAFVYRHFPLKQIHLKAELAAQAAEAAGAQGKFFEMHDLLFENQDDWAESPRTRALMTDYAQGLGLDMDRFKKDWGSKLTKGLVTADYMSGLVYQVDATPSFFINGERIKNPGSPEEFRLLLDAKLGSPSATPAL